jgi:ABC-type proline/glycine betaine transport system ATPase subunit
LECPAKKYVEKFINKQLPEKMNKNEVMRTMKQKGVMLDAIDMTEKRKKRKRTKTMNARERRKRGIFRISKQNQRFTSFWYWICIDLEDILLTQNRHILVLINILLS